MSDNSPTLHKAASNSLAKERLIWATRPMGLLAIVLWVLHPTTSSGADPIHLALLGFLAGIFYGLIVYGRQLKGYITLATANTRFRPNRVPEEYYWGNILQTMFDNK